MAEGIIVIAALGRPFGIEGWLHVRSFTEPASNVLRYRPWWLRRVGGTNGWQAATVETRVTGGGIVAGIAGCADREAAATLRGAEVGVDAAILPAPAADEYYWQDLAGLEAATACGQPLGRVARLFATPAHDVLVLADGERERLVPFAKATVLNVDLPGGRIVLDWQPDW